MPGLLKIIGISWLDSFDEKPTVKVPIDGVLPEKWIEFTKLFVNLPGGISEHFRYGIFEFTVKRLCDLGVMANPQALHKRGRLLWSADWTDGRTLQAFLDDHFAQYEYFARSMAMYADSEILQSIRGKVICDKPASLSGLLAIAHRAGFPGLVSWIGSDKVRDEFSQTTDYYLSANGIF